MFVKNWSDEARETTLKGDSKIFKTEGKGYSLEVKLKAYSTPRGERSCIVYDGSNVVTEAEYLERERSKDFTYRDIVDNIVLDYEFGIIWKVCGFGPVELDSSIFTYE